MKGILKKHKNMQVGISPGQYGSMALHLNNQGYSYYQSGNEKKARACWEEALKSDPRHLEAIFNLGCLKWKNAEINSTDLLQQLGSTEVRSPSYWLFKARIHYVEGNEEEYRRIQSTSHRVTDAFLTEAFSLADRPVGSYLRSFTGGSSGINSLICTPDGKHLVSGNCGNIILWNTQSGEEIKRFIGSDDSSFCAVCFSPDGKYILSGGQDHQEIHFDDLEAEEVDQTVKLWDLENENEIGRIDGSDGLYRAVCFSSDGKYILAGGDSGIIRMWDRRTGAELKAFRGHGDVIRSIDFSPKGWHFASGSEDGSIRIWDIDSGEEIIRLSVPSAWIIRVCFSPDGKWILSTDTGGEIRIWDVEHRVQISCFKGHTDYVMSACFSPDGKLIASAGNFDRTIRLWDVSSGMQIRSIEADKEAVFAVCFHPDGRSIFSGGWEGIIRQWEVRYQDVYASLGSFFPVRSVVFSADRAKTYHRLFISKIEKARACLDSGKTRKAYRILRKAQDIPGYERDSRLYDLIPACCPGSAKKDLKESWKKLEFSAHRKAMMAISFSPDGSRFLTAGDDRSIRLWNTASGDELSRLYGHTARITSACFSPDGTSILSGSYDNTIRMWDIEKGSEIRRIYKEDQWISSVNFSPRGYIIIARSYFVDYSSMEEVQRFKSSENESIKKLLDAFGDTISYYSFLPDGQMQTADQLNYVQWWTKDGKEIFRFTLREGQLAPGILSPDGRFALHHDRDGIDHLSYPVSGDLIGSFKGHRSQATSFCTSKNRRFMVSGSRDERVRLWRIEDGMELRQFKMNSRMVSAVAISPDERYILAGGVEGSLGMWELDWEPEFPNIIGSKLSDLIQF